jgi:hypothetical protein
MATDPFVARILDSLVDDGVIEGWYESEPGDAVQEPKTDTDLAREEQAREHDAALADRAYDEHVDYLRELQELGIPISRTPSGFKLGG